DIVYAKRNLDVGEGQGPHGRCDELLAPNGEQRLQYGLVEYPSRTDLLLDHVEAGLFNIGKGGCVHDGSGFSKRERHARVHRSDKKRPPRIAAGRDITDFNGLDVV